MIRKQIFLIFIAAIFCTKSYAQDSEELTFQKSTYFITGIGGSYVNVQDQGISPLNYAGIGGGAVLGHLRETRRSLAQSTARFDLNNASSDISGAAMFTYRLEGMYQHFFKSLGKDNGKWKVYPGLSALGRWVLRDHQSFTNNSQHIETRFSLAPSVLIKRPFSFFKLDFEMGIFSQLPLLTYATRPLFASTRFPSSVNKEEVEFFDYLKDGKIVSLGNHFRLSTQTYLLFPFKNGNSLRLDYFWMFESYNAQNPIKTGEHSLMISTFLKL